MPNNYNGIAKFYDVLSRIVFGRSIIKAQQYLIQLISENNKVLIVGGGTGWILEEISKLHKKNITIVYVEKSAAMIALAKKRNYKNISLTFIEAAIESCNLTKQFDVILTAFFFDNFKNDKILFVFKKLDAALKQNGIWLYADFVNDKSNKKLWQQFLLKTMYLFFRLTTNIETEQLIDMRSCFEKKYQQFFSKRFYRNFIQAIVYKKVIA